MENKVFYGLTGVIFLALWMISCSGKKAIPDYPDPQDTIILSTRFPMSKAGVLSIEKAVDTLIYNYPGQTIKQSLKTDSVLIVIWDGRYKYRFLLDRSKSLEIYGLDEKVKMYQIDAEIDGLDYWIDGYGLVATNPFGYPVFYDRGNTMAEVAIKALINDTTRFFAIMLTEEDTINIARIDSIRRRSE